MFHPDTSRQRVSARALFFRILPAFRYTERQHNRRILKGVASILISDHQVKFRPQTTPSRASRGPESQTTNDTRKGIDPARIRT